MATIAEKALAAEWLLTMAVETIDAIDSASTPEGFRLPNPSQYWATVFVFLILAGVAAVSDDAGRLAAAVGGVVMLAIMMKPDKNGRIPILGVTSWMARMMKGGPLKPGTGSPAPSGGSSSAPPPSSGLRSTPTLGIGGLWLQQQRQQGGAS